MTTNIRRFEVGNTYAVFHLLSDDLDTVTVAAREGNRVTFTDGRGGIALRSVGPHGDEETIRLGEVGPVELCVYAHCARKQQGAKHDHERRSIETGAGCA